MDDAGSPSYREQSDHRGDRIVDTRTSSRGPGEHGGGQAEPGRRRGSRRGVRAIVRSACRVCGILFDAADRGQVFTSVVRASGRRWLACDGGDAHGHSSCPDCENPRGADGAAPVSSRGKALQRSPCPVAGTLDLIGDKWTLLIIRDLLAGRSRYRELAASPEGIASNILAARLARLQQNGLVAARSSRHRAGSLEYHLTAKGRSLLPVLEAMRDWGLRHVPGTEARIRVGSTETGEPE